jgi:anti-anti-sigma regulatory factor
MAGADEGQRAVVVLVEDGREVVLGSIGDTIRCDLALVDELLKLQLITKRLGWTIRIVDVRPELRELFDLVGLTECVEPEP